MTGGVDFDGGHPELSPDRQVLHMLTELGVPFVHVVVAPCCDGESTFRQMEGAMIALQAKGCYRGCFPIDHWTGLAPSNSLTCLNPCTPQH